MKRIVITTSNDQVTDQRMIRIAETLCSMGFAVSWYSRILPGSPGLPERPWEQRRLRLWFRKGPLFYAELNIRLLIALIHKPFDILYTVDADTALAGIWIKRLRKIRLLFDAHEWFPEVPELMRRRLVKTIWKRIEKRVTQVADERITVSGTLAEQMEAAYGKPFTVVRNLPKQYHVSGQPGKDKYILYQGALNKGRGLEMLIQSATENGPDILLAGTGDLDDELKGLAGSLGVENKVKFLGRLDPETLKAVTRSAWLGYNVLENTGRSYFYSLSNKTFDFIQAGIPQLMSPFPEYEALNRDHEIGLLIPPDPKAIQQAVLDLEKNPERYQTLCTKALKAAKVLNWEFESDKVRDLFRSYL